MPDSTLPELTAIEAGQMLRGLPMIMMEVNNDSSCTGIWRFEAKFESEEWTPASVRSRRRCPGH